MPLYSCVLLVSCTPSSQQPQGGEVAVARSRIEKYTIIDAEMVETRRTDLGAGDTVTDALGVADALGLMSIRAIEQGRVLTAEDVQPVEAVRFVSGDPIEVVSFVADIDSSLDAPLAGGDLIDVFTECGTGEHGPGRRLLASRLWLSGATNWNDPHQQSLPDGVRLEHGQSLLTVAVDSAVVFSIIETLGACPRAWVSPSDNPSQTLGPATVR